MPTLVILFGHDYAMCSHGSFHSRIHCVMLNVLCGAHALGAWRGGGSRRRTSGRCVQVSAAAQATQRRT